MPKRAKFGAAGIKSRFAKANGVKLHYLAAGEGEPVIRRHGYAQNSHMWLQLVKGRERIYFEHFWNDFAADPRKSVSEADRRFYTKAYARPDAMRAGFEVFRAFDQDGKDFAQFAKTKLKIPMLVLSGEKAG